MAATANVKISFLVKLKWECKLIYAIKAFLVENKAPYFFIIRYAELFGDEWIQARKIFSARNYLCLLCLIFLRISNQHKFDAQVVMQSTIFLTTSLLMSQSAAFNLIISMVILRAPDPGNRFFTCKSFSMQNRFFNFSQRHTNIEYRAIRLIGLQFSCAWWALRNCSRQLGLMRRFPHPARLTLVHKPHHRKSADTKKPLMFDLQCFSNNITTWQLYNTTVWSISGCFSFVVPFGFLGKGGTKAIRRVFFCSTLHLAQSKPCQYYFRKFRCLGFMFFVFF